MMNTAELKALAEEAQCDTRSVISELAGFRVRGRAGVRVRAVLERRALLPAAKPQNEAA